MAGDTKELPTDFDAEALKRKYDEERSKRLRNDGNAQYQELTGKLAAMAEDPYVEPGFTREPVIDEIDVLIIGGGFSGLLTAGRLREAGVESIRIVDKAGDFGGTWYWNRYPGCACDIESYIYLPMLEETGYMPVEKYSKAPEIYQYCRDLGERYDLYRTALFQTVVTDLNWDEARACWIVSTDRNDRIAARFAVVAGGFLSQPKVPRIPGIDRFKGHSFHTSRWDYDYTGGDSRGGLTKLADKRVAIIGTGATALQCTPFLGQHAKHLSVFQRTPSSCDARNNQPTDPEWAKRLERGWQKRRMDNFHNIVSGMREPEDLVADGWTEILANIGFLDAEGGPPDYEALQLAEFAKMEKSRRRIDTIVKDKATAEALKPYYNYLCKRPGFNDEYLQTFNRENVTLVDTQGRGVERITEKGLVANGKEYEVDCIIYATGFEFLTEYAGQIGFEIHGKGGQALSERWSEGTRTFYGIQTRGFPNLFILGFAQNGITANFTHLAGERAVHLAYLIPRLLKDHARTVEPSQQAEDAWVGEIIAGRGPRRAFLDACTPSYYNQEGRETPATALNDIYGAGAHVFFKILEDWRAEDKLNGLEVTH
jgi:cyclohexanone monooxygenase